VLAVLVSHPSAKELRMNGRTPLFAPRSLELQSDLCKDELMKLKKAKDISAQIGYNFL
jgi:hypothetical protein